MTRVGIGIQARMASTRLPGKVLEKIGEWTALEHIVRRAQATRLPVTVLTPSDEEQRPIWDECERVGVRYLAPACAPERDVLRRYTSFASGDGLDAVVRLTADCPFIPVLEIERLLGSAAWLSCCDRHVIAQNAWPRQVPDGWDVELITTGALLALADDSTPEEREHVTMAAYRRWPKRLRLGAYPADWSSLRMTLDTPEDLAWFRAVAEEIDVTPPHEPSIWNLMKLLERRPDLVRRNPGVPA